MIHRALLLLTALLVPAYGQAQHPAEYWRAISQHGFAVPEGQQSGALAHELSQLLASPDPELRDDLAYSILARWIGRGMLDPQTLNDLTDEWISNLKAPGPDKALLRSFSALCLASMARRELRVPFMGSARYHQLVVEALRYLRDETDLRGWDPKLGWIHATAHTSDLIEALAANPQLSKAEEAAVVTAIATRVATAPHVYTQGEQDRMAAAMNAVVTRAGFDPSLADRWLQTVQAEGDAVWKKPLTEESLAAYQNHTYMLQAFAVRLSLDSDSATVQSLRSKVLNILKAR